MTPGLPERRWPGLLRWSGAALTVAALHAGAAWMALNARPSHAEAAAGAPEPAIMIELAAVSIAPEAPPETAPPAPEKIEPETPPEPVNTPPEPEPPPPPPEPVVEQPIEPPPPEPEPEPTPVQAPEPEIKLPELPDIPNALAVLAPPPPPEPARKRIEKPVERKIAPKPRLVERKPVERPRQAAAPPPAPPQAAAPNPAATGAVAQPTVSTASWRGSLIAHLNRYKRFPGGANPGTVQVAFAIDRGGNVLSARLAGSSGDSALDQEAVAMIRRASPVPAPPSGLGGGSISLAVPVRFSR